MNSMQCHEPQLTTMSWGQARCEAVLATNLPPEGRLESLRKGRDSVQCQALVRPRLGNDFRQGLDRLCQAFTGIIETAFHDGMARSCIVREDMRRGCRDRGNEQLEVFTNMSEMFSYEAAVACHHAGMESMGPRQTYCGPGQMFGMDCELLVGGQDVLH